MKFNKFKSHFSPIETHENAPQVYCPAMGSVSCFQTMGHELCSPIHETNEFNESFKKTISGV